MENNKNYRVQGFTTDKIGKKLIKDHEIHLIQIYMPDEVDDMIGVNISLI